MDVPYMVERILFGMVTLITFILFVLKFIASLNKQTIMPRELKVLTLFVNLLLGIVCVDPHQQIILSPIFLRALIRVSSMFVVFIIILLFNIYFHASCEKIYKVVECEKDVSINAPPRRNSRLSRLINKPENVEDSQLMYDFVVYTNWYFLVPIICLIVSFFYWHTFLFHAGLCFTFIVNAIQLHYKWIPYRVAYVHRLPINFEDYKSSRIMKYMGIYLSLCLAWNFLIGVAGNALYFQEVSLGDCPDLRCYATISLDYVLFISSIFTLLILIRFLVCDPISRPSAQQQKEESKTNNSPRPASDITSTAENLSLADKTIIARFINDTNQNVFIPLNTRTQEGYLSQEGKIEA